MTAEEKEAVFHGEMDKFLAEDERRKQNAKLNPYRKSHLKFIQRTWMTDADGPFVMGYHTKQICDALDEAMARFRRGESTFLQIKVPPRHGKSTMVSQYLPPHFLGEFPTKRVMQVSFRQELAADFSGFGRMLIQDEKYRELYPGTNLLGGSGAKALWEIGDKSGEPTGGRSMASGLTSGLTGSGFSLGIVDDFCGSRADAESKTIRDSTWNAFKDDFMTRRAKVCIVVVLATQWHWDDVHGRIKQAMKNDPKFPRFIDLTFPAKAEKYKEPEAYGQKYLFEEFFGETYYEELYATLGPYSSASLLDCSAYARTGGMLSEAGIVWEENILVDTTKRWARIWDLAHTAKQRSKDDPDWTSGTLLAFEEREGDPILHLWIKNVRRTRAGALERDMMIKSTARMDGPFIAMGVEVSLDAKDAAEYLRNALQDISFKDIQTSGDKGARATPLETIFATPGHVHVQRSTDWNDVWLDEVLRFDGLGKDHDDMVDNITAGYLLLVAQKTQGLAYAF